MSPWLSRRRHYAASDAVSEPPAGAGAGMVAPSSVALPSSGRTALPERLDAKRLRIRTSERRPGGCRRRTCGFSPSLPGALSGRAPRSWRCGPNALERSERAFRAPTRSRTSLLSWCSTLHMPIISQGCNTYVDPHRPGSLDPRLKPWACARFSVIASPACSHDPYERTRGTKAIVDANHGHARHATRQHGQQRCHTLQRRSVSDTRGHRYDRDRNEPSSPTS